MIKKSPSRGVYCSIFAVFSIVTGFIIRAEIRHQQGHGCGSPDRLIRIEAIGNIGRMSRVQQATFLESQSFINDLERLNQEVGIDNGNYRQSTNYFYSVDNQGDRVFHFAEAQGDAEYSYINSVFQIESPSKEINTSSITCTLKREKQLTLISEFVPVLEDGQLRCHPETYDASEEV